MLKEITSLIFQIYYQQPLFWYLSITLFGALAGSFITMLCHRLPIMLQWHMIEQEPQPVGIEENKSSHHHTLNLFFPRSFCPQCENTLQWWQNIPLISYLLIKGHCRFCHAKIHISYILIEIICAIASLLVALSIDNPIHCLWWLVFTWIAIPLAVIDSRYLLLPDGLNYCLLWSGLIFSLITDNTKTAIVSAIIGYLSFLIINTVYKWVRKREGIGQGDFKLLAGIAVWLGWYELPAVVLISSMLGLCYALLLFTKNRTINMELALPFAPFLLSSAWLWCIYLHLTG